MRKNNIDWEKVPAGTPVWFWNSEKQYNKELGLFYKRDIIYRQKDSSNYYYNCELVDTADVEKYSTEKLQKKYRLVRHIKQEKEVSTDSSFWENPLLGAGFHNSIYRGYCLGNKVTDEQYNVIDNGTFVDMFIGDYWYIDGVAWRIAAFDYYLHTGAEECTTHHVVIVPDVVLFMYYMNIDEVNSGYLDSGMYTEALKQAKEPIKKAFGESHIMSHSQYFSSGVEDGKWVDSTVDLMNEINVYGCKMFGDCLQDTNWAYNCTIDKTQFPLFRINPVMINPCRQWYWLRDVVSGVGFARVNNFGNADALDACFAGGIRPCFCLCK